MVEVFENWKDSVIFVSGPTAKTGSPATEEFRACRIGWARANLGSGFILHESGYIVTNAHGVERHIENMVTLSNGRTFPAELIARLHDRDLALLKINTPWRLKAVRLGRAGNVMIGETVIVISNPLGLMQTCTAGVRRRGRPDNSPGGSPGGDPPECSSNPTRPSIRAVRGARGSTWSAI